MKASWYIAVPSVAHAKLHFKKQYKCCEGKLVSQPTNNASGVVYAKLSVVSNWSILPMPCAVNNVLPRDIHRFIPGDSKKTHRLLKSYHLNIFHFILLKLYNYL